MTSSQQDTEKPASEVAVLKALASLPEAIEAGVAGAAGIGRSTARSMLDGGLR